jgi:hypothetical protein
METTQTFTRTQPLTAEPSAYQINPTDDQHLEGAAQARYAAIATALQAIEEIQMDPAGTGVNPKILKPLGMAERALRRAAWLTVVYDSTK